MLKKFFINSLPITVPACGILLTFVVIFGAMQLRCTEAQGLRGEQGIQGIQGLQGEQGE